MSDWKRGNYVGDCPHRVAVKSLVHRCAGQTVALRNEDGSVSRVSAVEMVIEQLFRKGIGGDIRAFKSIMQMALKYMEQPTSKKKETVWRRTREITQVDVDLWKSSGSLLENCSDVLADISVRDLNRAYRLHNKKKKALERGALPA